MELGVFFIGLVVMVGALGLVLGLRRRRRPVDPDDVMRASRDVGWAANYQPRPVQWLPAELGGGEEPVAGAEHRDVLEEYLFDPDELRSLGRDGARRQLRSLHLPAPQLEEVLDTLFAE